MVQLRRTRKPVWVVAPALPRPEQPTNGTANSGVNRFNLVAFDPSGNHLIALYKIGSATVWNVNPTLWERRACAMVGRPLRQDE
jgi:hypothetical protein